MTTAVETQTLYRVTFKTWNEQEFYSAFSDEGLLQEGVARRMKGGRYASAEVTQVERQRNSQGTWQSKERVVKQWTVGSNGRRS